MTWIFHQTIQTRKRFSRTFIAPSLKISSWCSFDSNSFIELQLAGIWGLKWKLITWVGTVIIVKQSLKISPHIFIDCPISKLFVARVTRLITERMDKTYKDNSNVVFITCNHPNPSINFLWAVAKYYISYNFQHQKDFHWKAFTNYLHRFFVGEKPQVVSTVRGALLPQ